MEIEVTAFVIVLTSPLSLFGLLYFNKKIFKKKSYVGETCAES